METIPLRDAIGVLRSEILAARQDASTEEVRFELGPIEMEFQVVASKEFGGDAKLGFHIFAAEATLGGSGKGTDERTQKVKFVLNPISVDASGHQTKVDVARMNQTEQGSSPEHTLERR
jgi:hypothetical protein